MQKSNTGFQFILKNGFCSELPTTTIPTSVLNEIIEEEIVVEKKPYELDVPSFMKGRVKPSKVVYLFSEEEQDDEHKISKKLKEVIGKARKIFVNLPPVKYFIDDYQQTKKEDK